MKKLAKAFFVFVAGSVVALGLVLGLKIFLVNIMGEATYRLPHFQMERLAQLRLKSPLSSARLLVLGDSTATFSIDASAFPDAESFATVNATSIETYYMLQKILQSGAKPKCVMAGFSFQWELNRGYFWPMFVAGGFYSKEELQEIEAVRKKNGEIVIPLLDSARAFAARQRWLDLNSLSRIQDSFFRWKWAEAQAYSARSTLWARKGSKVLSDSSNFEGSLEMFFSKPPSLTRTELDYFNRFLVLAREHGIPVFIVKIPFPSSVPLEKKLRYWQSYEELLQSVEAPFRLVSPPSMPEEFYISAGHLNFRGVNAMAPQLVKAVEGCYR